jgi:hypothetical protein
MGEDATEVNARERGDEERIGSVGVKPTLGVGGEVGLIGVLEEWGDSESVGAVRFNPGADEAVEPITRLKNGWWGLGEAESVVTCEGEGEDAEADD